MHDVERVLWSDGLAALSLDATRPLHGAIGLGWMDAAIIDTIREAINSRQDLYQARLAEILEPLSASHRQQLTVACQRLEDLGVELDGIGGSSHPFAMNEARSAAWSHALSKNLSQDPVWVWARGCWAAVEAVLEGVRRCLWDLDIQGPRTPWDEAHWDSDPSGFLTSHGLETFETLAEDWHWRIFWRTLRRGVGPEALARLVEVGSAQGETLMLPAQYTFLLQKDSGTLEE